MNADKPCQTCGRCDQSETPLLRCDYIKINSKGIEIKNPTVGDCPKWKKNEPAQEKKVSK